VPLRIYTRTGDDGSTALFGGQRVSKCDLRVEAYGTVDELNAFIGLASARTLEGDLNSLFAQIQHDLFAIGADLATPPTDSGKHGSVTVIPVSPGRTAVLERAIDHFELELPPLRTFILPGGTELASQLHICRGVCRRAERRVVELGELEAINPEIIRYLNRLSDLLFVLARTANQRAGVEDVPWVNSNDDALIG
jgi:cob(I)alamin adenosyltransferase